MLKRRRRAMVTKMSDGRQVLEGFREQPRSQAVWQLVIESIPLEPLALPVTINPETAQEWLRRRVSPAAPDPVRARQYAKIMAAGAWHPRDDEPIKLRVIDDGIMVTDGEHRLAAVVCANIRVKLLVRFSAQ